MHSANIASFPGKRPGNEARTNNTFKKPVMVCDMTRKSHQLYGREGGHRPQCKLKPY